MTEDDQILITVVVLSMSFLLLIVVFALLLVAAQNRRNKHKIEVAELERTLQLEVAEAEREATQNTMVAIGRELHDNVGQLLTAAQIGLMNRFDQEMQNDAQLSTIVDTLEEGISEVGRLGRSLNTDLWKEKSLFQAIDAECARIERIGKATVHVSSSGSDNLTEDERTIMYRIFQEVINNAFKHSQANTITLKLQGSPFEISIQDNGKGFDLTKVDRGGGIYNIEHRCELIGIEAILDAQPDQGCTWTFKRKT